MFYLCGVTTHRPPTFDLSRILHRQSTAQIIATIPLKPPTWIMRFVNPTFLSPNTQRLTCVDMKIVERFACSAWRELCTEKPRFWKFFGAIRKILSAKHSQGEHLFWRETRLEFRIKITSGTCGAIIPIPALHFIVDDHQSALIWHSIYRPTRYTAKRNSPPHQPRSETIKLTMIFRCHDIGKSSLDRPSCSRLSMNGLTLNDKK